MTDKALRTLITEIVDEALARLMPQRNEVKPERTAPMLLDYYREWITHFRTKVEAGMRAPSTLRKHRRVWQCLENFLKTVGQADIGMREADRTFLEDFQAFLVSQCHLSPGSIRVYLSPVIMLFRHAHDEGLISRFPFSDYPLPHADTERPFLTTDEMGTFSRCPCSTERETLVRDLFLFCCYTGLAFVDLKGLQDSDLVCRPVDGTLWMEKRRQKTKVKCAVKLLPKPLELLKVYNINSGETVFNVPSYKTCNRILSRLADSCGIKKHVTWHVARHTMATTVCLANGLSMETVSSILGHRNIRSTQIYAKVTEEKVAREMARLETALKTQ